jgi:ketosteroid isomerase-like protein
MPRALLSIVCTLLAACAAAPLTETPRDDHERIAVERLLDDWHAAAARADGAAYLGALEPGAIFMGTDASERWTRAEFAAYCEPYFARGQGWTYEPRERHVVVSGDLAWFDERLWNDKYGDCRGTGVVRRAEGTWRLAHYSLTFLIPNERAARVVEVVRGD